MDKSKRKGEGLVGEIRVVNGFRTSAPDSIRVLLFAGHGIQSGRTTDPRRTRPSSSGHLGSVRPSETPHS